MQNNNEAMGQQRKGEFNKKDVKKERLLHGRFELSTFRLHKLIAYETDALPTELVKLPVSMPTRAQVYKWV